MNFDRANDPKPLTAEIAVKRGSLFVSGPVRLLLFGLLGAGLYFFRSEPTLGTVLDVVAIPSAWLWWSFCTPRWRVWALSRGVDPDELQALAQAANIVWPRGSIFERTEFRVRPGGK